MLGCAEGAGMSPEVPQWPFLAYFKWYNLYFAELKSSIAHEPVLGKFGSSFPKLPRYVCVCALNSSMLDFSLHFHNSENILQTMNHPEHFGSILKQQPPQFSMGPGVHDCGAATAADLPACAVTTKAFWQHQNQWKTAQNL